MAASAETRVRVRWCAWCKAVTVFPGRKNDSVSLFLLDRVRVATVNGDSIPVQDGICEPCRAEKFPETPVVAAVVVVAAAVPKSPPTLEETIVPQGEQP